MAFEHVKIVRVRQVVFAVVNVADERIQHVGGVVVVFILAWRWSGRESKAALYLADRPFLCPGLAKPAYCIAHVLADPPDRHVVRVWLHDIAATVLYTQAAGEAASFPVRKSRCGSRAILIRPFLALGIVAGPLCQGSQ